MSVLNQKIFLETNESKEEDQFNDAFVHEDQEELDSMQSLISESQKDSQPESEVATKILLFANPTRQNLCFSNSVTSLLLNIPKFQSFISTYDSQRNNSLYKNKIMGELDELMNLPNFSKSSTHQLRSIVHTNCINSGQDTKTFGDKQQHDVSEYLMSILEHIFKDLPMSNNFDEKLFGIQQFAYVAIHLILICSNPVTRESNFCCAVQI